MFLTLPDRRAFVDPESHFGTSVKPAKSKLRLK
jgi:hypothetical protein